MAKIEPAQEVHTAASKHASKKLYYLLLYLNVKIFGIIEHQGMNTFNRSLRKFAHVGVE